MKTKSIKIQGKIISSLSNLLSIKKDQFNLKGKTVEKLGLIGKEKAIACETIVSLNYYANYKYSICHNVWYWKITKNTW